jgi:phosphoribosylaminoimidazolecarboxamide formyltransferase / IMP cyclohydrolase
MPENQQLGLRPIRRALISVSDKTGIVDFAHQLRKFGVEIISTGGTAKTLRDAGLAVKDVSEVTGFPEMMDGRVKTLHPNIHGALLGIRANPDHELAMRDHAINPIDLVVVNLYPFSETIAREGVTLAEAIEQIDIGGPAMIRSAAKNSASVAVVTRPAAYTQIVQELQRYDGALRAATRSRLAQSAFILTSLYDAKVFSYLNQQPDTDEAEAFLFQPDPPTLVQAMEAFSSLTSQFIALMPSPDGESAGEPEPLFEYAADLNLTRLESLRYGENPHQQASLYEVSGGSPGIAQAELLSGKEMSFNNYVDADAAWALVCDFQENACAIIKHTNPAGAAVGASAVEAYRRALATDSTSAFGGIVAFNFAVDEAAARAVTGIFTEVVVAPDFEATALEILKAKKNLRVLRVQPNGDAKGFEYKQISGGMLAQTRDTHQLQQSDLQVVTKRAPTADEIRDLMFAWTVCKHTKSNAIVYARDRQTVGVGAGQMSRIDSVKIGAMRAQLPVKGSVLASDAFFPFRDGLDEAAKHGITAVIEPGGSMRDAEVIAAADEHDLAMVFTGIRHFKH